MCADVTKWLKELGLGQYAVFVERDIDWDLLPNYHETLIYIGVSSPGHRLRIIKAAKSIQGELVNSALPQRLLTYPQRSPAHGEAERR